MVLHNGSYTCELQKGNKMDPLQESQDKFCENPNDVSNAREKVCETIVMEERKETVETLQSAFLKFKRNRRNKLKQYAVSEDRSKQNVRTTEQMDQLRKKFVEQAKSYFGVPYARRYHEPGSPEYDAPLFLDCCGLVRKVLRDLKEDFGFFIGPWNQAYMFDTLPGTIENVKEMKPGDLVFVSGVFFNPKKRKQKHNMVHVEIWAGDGEKTIGARWQKGKVQIHDSYQYVSKSYYNMVYHFKSIDTWLRGTCKSFCSQHRWRTSARSGLKKSIFSTPQSNERADDLGEEESFKENEGLDETAGNVLGRNVSEDEQVNDNDEEDFVKSKTENRYQGNEEAKTGWVQDVRSNDQKDKMEGKIIDFKKDLIDIKTEHCDIDEEDSAVKEDIFSDNTCLTCFCSLCTSDVDPSVEDKASEQVQVLNGSCPLESNNENGYNTNSEVDYVNTSLSLDNINVEVTEVTTRPNSGGGAEGGGARKQGLMKNSVNKRERGGTRRRGNNDDDQTNNPRDPSKPFCRPSPSSTSLHQKAPTFFIGGHNGAKMVEATLSSLGWNRIYDKHDQTFYLKWVECKRNLDFLSFREGEQLVNHIPNGNVLTTKIGLLTSLQEFERVNSKIQSPSRRAIQMKDFVPETFKLQNQTEINNFIQHIYQDGEIWICKPTGMNQGKGIFLIRNRDELLEKLGPLVNNQGRQRCFPSPGRVVQRYILNPFLLNGYKADIRTYMLIAGTSPYMVFYYPGYVRLSLVPYSLNQEEVHAHLTNQYIQKKHPLYEQVKEETVWSLEQLQEYVSKSSNNALPSDWMATSFTKRMQEIMLHCFQSVRYKLERKLGYFDLLGFDFMLDEDLKVWLIEINVNPALHTNCKILSDVIPELVDSTLKLVLEVFEKSKKREKVTPLENLGKFQLIFSDDKR
ncbi:uncharacterized protein LOC114518086 [Dendronephthya gigantea]|uniref:uncharacterized protein LOC114518086 n=1 Tax=Dendronephthya gigantea TaxID=151771 RepID=UPI001069EFE7|nr:uncharacterized protein LOC114518086 [Dendronephthya gigantea]